MAIDPAADHVFSHAEHSGIAGFRDPFAGGRLLLPIFPGCDAVVPFEKYMDFGFLISCLREQNINVQPSVEFIKPIDGPIDHDLFLFS